MAGNDKLSSWIGDVLRRLDDSQRAGPVASLVRETLKAIGSQVSDDCVPEGSEREGYMFSSCEYDFCEGGVAYDRVAGIIGQHGGKPTAYRVVAGDIHWVWDDGHTSEAGPEIQDEWQRYLAGLVVE